MMRERRKLLAKTFILTISLISIFLFYDDAQANICTPQCTEYVNNKLQLNHKVGSAVNWWYNPPSGYKRYENCNTKEKPSKKAIIVWKDVGGGNGHVAIVKERKDGIIIITDSNWAINWRTDCKERTRELKYEKKGGKYCIQDSNVLGWLER